MTTRRNRRVQPRPRVYEPQLRAHDSGTSGVRETLVRPNKGKRLRIIRVRAIQEVADGRRLYEVYLRDRRKRRLRTGQGGGHAGRTGAGRGLHPPLSPGRGSARAARRTAQRPLGQRPVHLPQDNHRIHRGKLRGQIA